MKRNKRWWVVYEILARRVGLDQDASTQITDEIIAALSRRKK